MDILATLVNILLQMAEVVEAQEGEFQDVNNNSATKRWDVVNGMTICKFEGCTKAFKTKAGFNTHYRRKHSEKVIKRDR